MSILRVKEVAGTRGVVDTAKLARRTDIAYATAHRLWNGEIGDEATDKGPGLLVLHRIAKSLGVKIVDLFTEDQA